MKIEEDFEGYKEWVEGSRQTIIGEPGDTREDVIKFMHAHIDHFGLRGKFTFDAARIEQNGNDFIVTIHKIGYVSGSSRFRIHPPFQPDEL